GQVAEFARRGRSRNTDAERVDELVEFGKRDVLEVSTEIDAAPRADAAQLRRFRGWLEAHEDPVTVSRPDPYGVYAHTTFRHPTDPHKPTEIPRLQREEASEGHRFHRQDRGTDSSEPRRGAYRAGFLRRIADNERRCPEE